MTIITQVPSPAAWHADRIAVDRAWIYQLSERDQADVISAVSSVEVAVAEVTPATFPLPGLGPTLARLAAEVRDGRGFILIQGVPVDRLDDRGRDVAAVGIATHFGPLMPQGPNRLPFLHVRDEGLDPAAPSVKSYQHRRGLGFHADPTDMVALLCLRPAKSGGQSSIVSSVAIHNELVRTRPDLARLLYQPEAHDGRPVYARSEDGTLATYYAPDYRPADPPDPARHAATTALDALHRDPRFVLEMDFQAGDMQFLNNNVVLHRRTAYEDHPEPERRRDLIRLWLARL